jgi:neutral ceramidase
MLRRLVPLLALAAALAVPAAASAAAPIEVGVGRADITPPTGYVMMGWVRSDGRIQGAHTRLYARVIVLKQGNRKLALVSEDLNGIPGGMMKQAADADRDIGFSERNVLDSASHTHAAPTSMYNFSTYNSVFMTLNSPTDFDLQGKLDPQLYAFQVRRLALAIRRANADLGPGAIGWGGVNIDDLTQNRSIEAHLYDRGIHLPYGQGLADMDPLGRLRTIDPEGHVLRVDRVQGTRRIPLGVWSTFANHGTVNKYQFTFYNEDHHGAATQGVEKAIRRAGKVPAGQDVVTVYGNSDEGDMSSGLNRDGPAAADYVGKVESAAFLSAWRDAGKHMQRQPAFDWRWTRMCFCGQMTAAGPVDDQGQFGLAEFTGSEEGRGPLYDITHQPLEGQHLPVGTGPQGDKEQTPIPLDIPKAVPMMALRVGDRVIASVPGEMTEEMGYRVRQAVVAAAGASSGVKGAVIAGLANEYADYFTTPEEYDAQHYEGAATVYGRASSVALQEMLVTLTGDLVGNKPAPAPYSFDPTNGVSPAADPFSTGAAKGTIAAQPLTPVGRLAHPEFSWTGGQRGFDRPLDTAFIRIQRRVAVKVRPSVQPGSRPHRKRKRRRHGAPAFAGAVKVIHRWKTVDSDLGLNTLWKVDSDGRYTARWEVPLGATAGQYRFVVTANHYRLVSHAFKVIGSQALSVERAGAPAGTVALRLAYPAAVSHEKVGDPPGDFSADLTYRPPFASSGTATVVVGGKKRTVKGKGGLFSFSAPAGTPVSVAAGAVRDRYGNANSARGGGSLPRCRRSSSTSGRGRARWWNLVTPWMLNFHQAPANS